MFPPAPQSDAQEGFIIIEVLVSALILAIVGGAVLTLIAATTRGAATQRSHSVAYDLAQGDQARLRTMRIPELNRLSSTATPKEIDGTNYFVESKAEFVNNQESRVSCSEGSDSQDYIELTSTVTAATMHRPVSLQSVVAPTSGSLDTAHGPLVVETVNAAGNPVSGVTVELPSIGLKKTTETQGCANFPEVPVGANQSVIFKGGELVNPEGSSEQTEKPTITAESAAPARLETKWDRPATLEPEFVYLEPGTGTLQPAPVDSMLVTSSANGLPKPFGTPGGARSSIQVDSKAYPFASPAEYTVYAGSCATNNPGTSTTNKVGLYTSVVLPGAKLKPQIHVPALQLTVTVKEGKEGKTLPVRGATVTLTDLKCKVGSSGVKRTYTTNGLGHLSNEVSVKEEIAGRGQAPNEAGVPFGAYRVCASATINGEFRSVEKSEVKVEDFTAGTLQKPGGTVLTLNLEGKTTNPC